MFVLDTNVVSELFRPSPDPGVLSWVDAQPSSDLRLTAITAAELRAGVALLPSGRRRAAIAARVEELLDETFGGYVLAFDAGSTPYYAEVLAARRRAGAPVAALDAQLAAICCQHSAVLVTRNVADFAGTGADVLNPWSGSSGESEIVR